MSVFSVTRVLGKYSDFSAVSPDVLENAAERGKRVHAVCAAYAKGMPILIVEPSDEGYFESFKRWFDQYVDAVHFVETEFRHPLGFVGHPDLGCRFNGQNVVVDLKTPRTVSRLWEAQIAAYCAAAGHHFGGEWAGLALRLDPDGGPAKATVYKNLSNAFAAFVSALNAHRFFTA